MMWNAYDVLMLNTSKKIEFVKTMILKGFQSQFQNPWNENSLSNHPYLLKLHGILKKHKIVINLNTNQL